MTTGTVGVTGEGKGDALIGKGVATGSETGVGAGTGAVATLGMATGAGRGGATGRTTGSGTDAGIAGIIEVVGEAGGAWVVVTIAMGAEEGTGEVGGLAVVGKGAVGVAGEGFASEGANVGTVSVDVRIVVVV